MRSAAWFLAFAVVLAACAKPATKADYDKISKGMTHADVDKALDALGSGKPVDAKDVLDTFGGMETGEYRELQSLNLFRWGTKKDAMWIAFGARNEARVKVLKTREISAMQHLTH
jgi:hypothetical protein